MKILKKNHKDFFKDKKITVIGLGLLGRGIGDVIFLAQNGADLLVTDLKTKEQLVDSLKKIKKELDPVLYKKIKFVLGEHQLEDFRDKDFILKSADIPLNSIHIAEARKNKIPIKMDASWFAELAPLGVKIIGVTGTRGKSTVTHLIYEILKNYIELSYGRGKVCCNVYLGGNVRGLATLPLLKKINPPAGGEDIVVMELDSWQLQGFGETKISPNISVFTNLMIDHQNYYHNNRNLYFADKANIYRWQKKGDIIVAGTEISKKIKLDKPKGKLIVLSSKNFPTGWGTKLLGEHNLFNVALAVEVARALGVSEKIIKKTVANFGGVPGRLEFIREFKGIKYYNDTTATTPDGVIVALGALSGPTSPRLRRATKPRIVLVGGGQDKKLDYKKYAGTVKKLVKALILFKGTATDKIIATLGPPAQAGKTKIPIFVVDNMPNAFNQAQALAQKGDTILLSPGAASFGVFKNEFDRGDQFVKLVKKIK